MYYRRRRLNKWGITFALPYLVMMGICFDILFFGKNYFSQYMIDFKQPILYQINLLHLIGLEEILNKFLSFFQLYILITTIVTIILYNFGRFVDHQLSKL